jgi:hypothetical protein
VGRRNPGPAVLAGRPELGPRGLRSRPGPQGVVAVTGRHRQAGQFPDPGMAALADLDLVSELAHLYARLDAEPASRI